MSNTCGITEAMAKAQGAPISIKPGAELLALVDAWAKARGVTRHAAILQLIRAGLQPRPTLAAVEPPLWLDPKTQAVRTIAKPPKASSVTREPDPKPAFKSRLKGEWKAP